MRIATWNVNGLRARLDFLRHWLRDRRHGEGLEQIHGHTESGVKYSQGTLEHRQPLAGCPYHYALVISLAFYKQKFRLFNSDRQPRASAFGRVLREPLLAEHGLQNILVAFPNTLEELKPVFAMAGELSSRFVAINAKVFPFTPQEGAAFVRASLDLAASMGVEAHFELHRFTLTNDLFYTAQVMDLVPEMEIVADLSHAVVSREIMLPLDDLHADLFHKVVDRAAGLQGRVASRSSCLGGAPATAP